MEVHEQAASGKVIVEQGDQALIEEVRTGPARALEEIMKRY